MSSVTALLEPVFDVKASHARIPVSTPGRTDRAGKAWPVWHVLMVVGVAIAVFAPALGHDWVGDDTGIIVANSNMGDLSRFGQLLTQNYWGEFTASGSLWRPVTLASFGLDAWWFGRNPFFFHLVNVLLHATASLLCYAVARRALRTTGALVAALVFAVHPVHVEAVSGVVGRAEVLAGLFGLAAIWVHLRRPPRVRAVVAVGMLYLLAMGAKESAILLPMVLMAADVVRSRRGGGRIRLWPFAVYATVAAGYLGLRHAVLGPHVFGQPLPPYTAENPLWWVSGDVRVLTAISLLGRYFWLLVCPVFLSIDYSFNAIAAATGMWTFGVLASACLFAAWSAGAVLALRRGSGVALLALALFLAPLLVVCNLFFPIGTIFAERFLYLPAAAVALLLGTGFDRVAVGIRPGASPGRRGRRGWWWVAAAGLVVLSGRTLLRERDWKNDETLYRAAVATCPESAKAHYDHGNALARVGKIREAIQAYRRSLDIKPDFLAVYLNLGRVLETTGLHGKAGECFQRGVQIAPDHGGILYRLGQHRLRHASPGSDASRQAVQILRRAVDRLDELRDAGDLARQGAATGRQVLAQALFHDGRSDEAFQVLSQAVDLAPEMAAIQKECVVRLIEHGCLKDARAAIDILPDSISQKEKRGLEEQLAQARREATPGISHPVGSGGDPGN
jgi:protein O-mannosyl-transferase